MFAVPTTSCRYADENNGTNFDYVIINSELNEAFEEIKTAIAGILAAVDEAAPQEAKAPAAAAAAPAVAAPVTPAKAVAAPAPAAATPTAAPASPHLAAMLKAKESELEAAMAAKDRTKVRLGSTRSTRSASAWHTVSICTTRRVPA
jgi:hypothetical protein